MKKVIIMLMLFFFSSLAYADTEEAHGLALSNTQLYNRAVGGVYLVKGDDLTLESVLRASNEDGNTFVIYVNGSSTKLYQGNFSSDILEVGDFTLSADTAYILAVYNTGCGNRNNAHEYSNPVSFPYDNTYGTWTQAVIGDASCAFSSQIDIDNDMYSILSINVTSQVGCAEVYLNTSDYGWSNYTNCHEPYLRAWQQLQRNYTRYDNASCGTYPNTTFFEYTNITCETFIYTNDFNLNEMILALVLFDVLMTLVVIYLLIKGFSIAGVILGFVSLAVDFMLTGFINDNLMTYAVSSSLFAIGMLIFTYALPVAKTVLLFTVHYKR